MSHSDLGYGITDLPIAVRVERPWVSGSMLPPDVPVISDDDDRGGSGLIIIGAALAMVFGPAAFIAWALAGWWFALVIILAGNIAFAVSAWILSRP